MLTLQYFMQYNSCVDEKRQQHIAEKKWGHMEEYLKGALEIVKAQAGVRAMTEEEMIAMVKVIMHAGLKFLAKLKQLKYVT